MNNKIKGTVCGILSAVSYGTNPLGALNLYAEGLNPTSVIFYRYCIAALILAIMMMAKKTFFLITQREAKVLISLGILMAASSLSLYSSFNFMDAGIASTLLFVYPVMVAVMMAMFFKEKLTTITILSIMLALGGISMLSKGGDGATLSLMGVALVMVSSLTYAVYIIIVNKSAIRMSSIKLTFWVLLTGTICTLLYSFFAESQALLPLSTPRAWLYATVLAVFPTVISLILMVIAVNNVGSTPTAVMGALEPITAVCIGVFVFGEAFTPRLAIGCVLILVAVMMIVAGNSLKRNKITIVVSRIGNSLKKRWRWRS